MSIDPNYLIDLTEILSETAASVIDLQAQKDNLIIAASTYAAQEDALQVQIDSLNSRIDTLNAMMVDYNIT
jgi:hypothetical protein